MAAARTFEAPIILIDLEWEHLMNEQQIRSVAKQVVSGVNSVGTEQSNEAHCGKLARQWGQQLASRPAGLQRRPFTQVRYCYAANCKTERPVALWLSGRSAQLCLALDCPERILPLWKAQSLAKPARRTVVGGVLVQASMRTRRCVAFFSRASLPFHPSACTSMHANTERSPVCHRDYLPVPFCPSGRHSPILSGPTSSGEWLPRERLV